MRNVILGAGVAIALVHGGMLIAPADDLALAAQVETDLQPAADFEIRVQRYVELHRALERTVPTPVSDDWAEIRAAIDSLAVKIRASRSNAQQGNIFSPDIECWFRLEVAESLAGCSTDELLARMNEENPEGLLLLPQVNGQWPEEASLGFMPPKLLADLPPLPKELQYRFMNRDLILWDVHANIIVDFITNAMPESSRLASILPGLIRKS